MDVGGVLVPHFVVAPLYAGPQIAVLGGIGLADEGVSGLVADQRLGHVVEVRDKHFRRRRTWRDGPVVGADKLNDAQIGVEYGAHKDGALGKRIPDYHWWHNRSTGPVTYSEPPRVVASALLSYNTENAKPLITPATTIAAANIG